MASFPMPWRSLWIVAMFVVFAPIASQACEPIVPLYQLMSGSTLAGPAIITDSFWWLLGAVLIKTLAFVWFEKSLSPMRGAAYMLAANVISTIPGVLLAALTSSIGAFFFALLLVAALGAMWNKRLARLPQDTRSPWLSGYAAPLWFILLFVLSIILYEFAGTAVGNRNFGTYWVLKFAFVTMVAMSGIIISAVLEECVIANITSKTKPAANYFTAVFRANYITLGIVLFFAAMQMLPKRLHSPGFLATWLDFIIAKVG